MKESKMRMRYTLVINGCVHRRFATFRDLTEYLVYSPVLQKRYRSVCFTGNRCEILARDNFDKSTAKKPIPQDEVVRDLRNCVETLNQSLDNYFDVTGDNDESADAFVEEIKAKYNF